MTPTTATTQITSSVSPPVLARFPASLASPVYHISIPSSNTCVGKRLDVSADGLIATAVLSCAVGLVSWVRSNNHNYLFCIDRPLSCCSPFFVHGFGPYMRCESGSCIQRKYDTFFSIALDINVPQSLRPRHLSSSLLAFLNPQIPLFPSLPADFSGTRRSDAEDARLFPSDEQLSQRFLWLAFVIASGWSIIGLGGALPLYLVNISCTLANSTGFYGGAAPLLLELSVLRLLRIFDTGLVSTKDLTTAGDPWHARIRVIVVTILALAGGLFPAVYLVLREFNKLVEYRRRWIEMKCHGNELGWLSASRAPGFVGWGEKQMKKFIISLGLTSSLDATEQNNGNRTTRRRGGTRRRRLQERALNGIEQANLGVDIQMLFSIGFSILLPVLNSLVTDHACRDTQRLAALIFERDGILEHLETAESKYITSFRITTPDPSVLDFELNVPPPNPERPYISLPQPLGGHRRVSGI